MVERLSWMDEVAEIKRERGLPVQDAQREAELLRMVEAKGVAAGLPATDVRDFFAGQLLAAREFQSAWMRGSQIHARAEPLPDLTTTVRPALDRIGEQMIEALAEARRQQIPIPSARERALRELTRHHYPEPVIQSAVDGLVAGLD